MYAFLIFI